LFYRRGNYDQQPSSINRRQYSAEFKAKVVLQVLGGEKSPSDICRTHKLHASVLNRWRKEFLEQAVSIFEHEDTHSEVEQRIAELERLVGQLTLQLEIAKKATSTWSLDKNGRRRCN
jgi:transposase-like protein